MIKEIKETLYCVFLLALIFLIFVTADTVATASRAISSANLVVAALPAQVDARVDKLQTAVLAEVDKQTTAVQKNLSGQITATRTMIDDRVGDSLGRIDRMLGQSERAVVLAENLEKGVSPTLEHVESITAHADEAAGILLARNALPAQILGTVGAAKVAFGETATTMRDIQRATPAVIEIVKQTGANIQEATSAGALASTKTAEVMGNFAVATKPLPKWLRVSLQIGGPVAMMANYFSLMANTLGWL